MWAVIQDKMPSAPLGILALNKIIKIHNTKSWKLFFQLLVLILTFISYAALHACRKVLPVVKPRLQGDCHSVPGVCVDGFGPFDGSSRSFFFGVLDTCWSASYSCGMLFMGYAAERAGKKLFLSISLLGTAFSVISFGLGYYLEIHSFYYYLYLQIFNGIFQSGGWPTLVPIVSAWVPRKRIGTILGIWGNHYAIGNIMGQTISSVFVDDEWGMAFIVNGAICGSVGLVVILLLASKPCSVGIDDYKRNQYLIPSNQDETTESGEIIEEEVQTVEEQRVGFWQALFLPGVLEYAFSLFFCKIVVYTFLFWLPFYIKEVGITNYTITPSTAGLLAALFDGGGILGNIIHGYIMDVFKRGGVVVLVIQIFSAISIYLFSAFGHSSFNLCVAMLLLAGFFVNSPNSLITGTISANLSNHPKLNGNKHGGSIITAIVDGVGCMGAVVAPLIVGQISHYGWHYVMYTLIISCLLSGLLLTRQVISEISK